ncbi:MAG: ArsR/SmtB family transcription factor [Pseudomonadales bacterium]
MPSRVVVASELAEIFKVIAHPDRIRIIEELWKNESDVSTLAHTLGLSGPRVSQHLNQLRLNRIVSERREGRRHIYFLLQPDIATWMVEALAFIEGRGTTIPKTKINSARRLWGQ